ncbi:hypothetical protein F0562_016589 [Nyssa sinensis]|uniref:Uncharacterized protein n=1 Tax=Nyssa sinensis TaxID=561372 RepID=A0A5J4ZEV8_9ASTE|nr:hypothetical protein F0562_016589 [Nyssa sinensis]
MEELFGIDKLESAFGGRNSNGFNYEAYAARMKEADRRMSDFINSGCSSPSYTPSVMSESQQSDTLISDIGSEASDEGGSSSNDEAASNLEGVDEKIQGLSLGCEEVANIEVDATKEHKMGKKSIIAFWFPHSNFDLCSKLVLPDIELIIII